MRKSERRKARKAAQANGLPLTGELSLDRDNGPCEFSPERYRNGKINHKRAKALERYAKFVYDYDRD